MPQPEHELVLKLMIEHHLNVPERRSLPDGKVRASVVRKLAIEQLNSIQCFPEKSLKPTEKQFGESVQLERRDKLVILHQNHESSLYQYTHKETSFTDHTAAIYAYLELMEKFGLDGIKVDWKN